MKIPYVEDNIKHKEQVSKFIREHMEIYFDTIYKPKFKELERQIQDIKNDNDLKK